jgi:hypothetical protein
MSSQTPPLLIEGPKDSITPLIAGESASASAAAETETLGWKLPAYAPIVAMVTAAIVVGAIAGAAATVSLMRDTSQPPAEATATRALQNSVAQLGNDLSTLKSGIATAQRSSNTQFSKLAERLDHTEKAAAEPAAKLAKLQESVDRIEQKQQQVAMAAVAPKADRSEVTGSITPKEESKPPVAEGWRLRDFYSGRALVESRNGTLFEVQPGSNLPGLGKVETVKRENGQVVVATKGGIIAGSFEQRRPAYYQPYRY